MKFINLTKLNLKDHELIKQLSLPMIYRYSLKLIRTYPSIKREEMREAMILGKSFLLKY
jgi:hypothetical protein